MCNIWDLHYTETLIRHVLTELLSNQSDTLSLGNTNFPVPPANVGKHEFLLFFELKM